MRKILVLLLTLTMMVSLFGCGTESPNPSETPGASGQTDEEPVDGTEEVNIDDLSPLEIAQGTYQSLNALAAATDMVGSDICKAWYAGIWDADNVAKGGAAYLSEKLTMSEDELREGVAHMAFSETGEDWDSITDTQWEELRQKDSLFADAQKKDALFDFCINVVWSGYLELDFYDTIDETMSQIKEIIRELKEKDPDNEYIDPLKEYYGVIRSYLEWCKAPDGSYNEAEELLNSYIDSYRSYRDDLEFDLGE